MCDCFFLFDCNIRHGVFFLPGIGPIFSRAQGDALLRAEHGLEVGAHLYPCFLSLNSPILLPFTLHIFFHNTPLYRYIIIELLRMPYSRILAASSFPSFPFPCVPIPTTLHFCSRLTSYPSTYTLPYTLPYTIHHTIPLPCPANAISIDAPLCFPASVPLSLRLAP